MRARLQDAEAVIILEGESKQSVVRTNLTANKTKDWPLRDARTYDVTLEYSDTVNQFFPASEMLPPSLQPSLVLTHIGTRFFAFPEHVFFDVW